MWTASYLAPLDRLAQRLLVARAQIDRVFGALALPRNSRLRQRVIGVGAAWFAIG